MPDPVDLFIARWEASGAAEKASRATRDATSTESLTTFATPATAVSAPVKKFVRTSPAPPTTSALPWPDKLPEQVARIRALVAELGTDPAALSARFGRANKKREEQIAAILETLRGLGL